MGTILEVRTEGTNRHFTLNAEMAAELKVDQSVAHDGVCLTVVSVEGQRYTVTAVEETLSRTTLGTWEVDDVVNLERPPRRPRRPSQLPITRMKASSWRIRCGLQPRFLSWPRNRFFVFFFFNLGTPGK